jgi:hypothetical protein
MQLQQLGVDFLFVFQGIICAGNYHRTTNIGELLAVGPNMTKVLTVVALRKASLISV